MKKSLIFVAPLAGGLFFFFLNIGWCTVAFPTTQSVQSNDRSAFQIDSAIIVKEINTDGYEAEETETYAPNSPHFYVAVHYSNAGLNTQLEVKWENRDTKTLILKNTYSISHSKKSTIFSLSRPFNGWPEGNYQVSFLNNGKLLHQRSFRVEK